MLLEADAGVHTRPSPRPPRTITASYPNPALLAAAAEAVTVLLRSPSHNLKYVGLDALAGITRVSPKYALDHQVGRMGGFKGRQGPRQGLRATAAPAPDCCLLILAPAPGSGCGD